MRVCISSEIVSEAQRLVSGSPLAWNILVPMLPRNASTRCLPASPPIAAR